jgi:hypothetical protein
LLECRPEGRIRRKLYSLGMRPKGCIPNVLQISEGKALKNENLILKINIIMKTKMSNYRNCFALAYVLLVAVSFVGCTSQKGESSVDTGKDYSIKVIDSCEYIECDYGIFDQRVYSLTHKGNCKFCLARNAK